MAGLDVTARPDDVRRRLGVVFQSPALDSALTCRESLGLQAALYGIPRADRAATVAQALADADLGGRADDRVGTLSGGLARRLDLVRGLLHRPALSLLDEPTVGLDPLARQAFWATLDARREGAQLVTTHDMDEAERCDRVVILDHGRVVADGAPGSLRHALGADALWLDGPDPAGLAQSLTEAGTDAVAVAGRVSVRTSDAHALAGALYARPNVQGVSIHPPTMADVFAHAVGAAPVGPTLPASVT